MTAPMQPGPQGELPTADVLARLAHLFRGARRQGRIHPLEHLIQRHRAQAGTPAGGPSA